MKKLSKTKRIIIIVSIAIVGVLITYFGGSMIATAAINNSLYNHRCDIKDEPYTLLQKTRDDYPLLANRKEFKIDHYKIKLQGYLYEVNNPKGLVVTAHGINSYADSDHTQYQNYFVENNWNVLSFDMTGCGRSEGKGMNGLFESRYCVESVLSYVKNDEELNDLPICLFGYSWGAYGVASASKNLEKVCAIAAISGFNAPNEMMFEYVANYKSKALYIGRPGLDFSLGLFNGNKVFYKATDEIKKHQDINYMVVQGSNDDVVYYNASIYSKYKTKTPDNVQLEYIEGAKHIGIWRTDEANSYYNEVKAQYDQLEKEYKGNIPSNVLDEFVSGVDKDRSSEMNLSLINKINDMFSTSVN